MDDSDTFKRPWWFVRLLPIEAVVGILAGIGALLFAAFGPDFDWTAVWLDIGVGVCLAFVLELIEYLRGLRGDLLRPEPERRRFLRVSAIVVVPAFVLLLALGIVPILLVTITTNEPIADSVMSILLGAVMIGLVMFVAYVIAVKPWGPVR
jgi:drug/metabolite transporter (DMT)-like permease